MRIGIQDKTTDLLRLEAAKKLLGSNNLMVDAIMGTNPNKWNYDTALKWSEDLEQFDVYWLEEPFNPIQVYNYSKLRMNSKISIAGGEALNQSLEFDLYKATAAVDIIQPDVTNSGGISDCKTIVSMFGKENVAMHVWGSQIAINANEHFARALGVKFLEKPMMELTINEEIICDRPGLGIKITDNIKSKYKLKPKENFKI
jgi:L-alanine-DL-glutamate epimerase-like enolase superfamily enzyme